MNLTSQDPTQRIQVSFFSDVRHTVPILRNCRPDHLLDVLASRTWTPAILGDLQARKLSTPLISGAAYPPGGTRCRDHVTGVHLAVIDADNATRVPTGAYHLHQGHLTDRPVTRTEPVARPLTVADAADRLWAAGAMGLAYSTLSHSPTWPRTRIILFLAASVPASDWPLASDWILERLGLDQRLECIDIPHTRNPAAISVLPTPPLQGPLIRQRVDGSPLEVPLAQVRERTLYQAPVPPWQRDMHMARLSRAGLVPLPTTIWPVVIDPAMLLQQLGCVIYPERPWRYGTKRRTTCPWAREHTGGVDDDAGVIYYPIHGRPSWRCSHSGHTHLGVADLLRAAGRG